MRLDNQRESSNVEDDRSGGASSGFGGGSGMAGGGIGMLLPLLIRVTPLSMSSSARLRPNNSFKPTPLRGGLTQALGTALKE